MKRLFDQIQSDVANNLLSKQQDLSDLMQLLLYQSKTLEIASNYELYKLEQFEKDNQKLIEMEALPMIRINEWLEIRNRYFENLNKKQALEAHIENIQNLIKQNEQQHGNQSNLW